MGASETLSLVADLAEAQQGLVTTGQATVLGVQRQDLARLAISGGFERVGHGVYRIAGASRPRLLELRVAWLQLAPRIPVDQRTIGQGVVSHVSATAVHVIGLLESFQHEFTLPPGRRVRSRHPEISVHYGRMNDPDVEWADEILVTTPVRTVTDLCAARIDGGHLASVVADILDKKLAAYHELAPALEPYAVHYGMESSAGDLFLNHLLSQGGKFDFPQSL